MLMIRRRPRATMLAAIAPLKESSCSVYFGPYFLLLLLFLILSYLHCTVLVDETKRNFAPSSMRRSSSSSWSWSCSRSRRLLYSTHQNQRRTTFEEEQVHELSIFFNSRWQQAPDFHVSYRCILWRENSSCFVRVVGNWPLVSIMIMGRISYVGG